METKVSIIIPVYNSEAYLEQCLDSLSNQSLKEIEIICIDDASTDRSLEILKTYERQDNRFKIASLPKSGQGMARNQGLKMAKGEFIGFVDSDDWPEPDMFSQLYDAALKSQSEISFCFPRCLDYKTNEVVTCPYFDSERKWLGDHPEQPTYTQDEIIKLLPFMAVVPWNKIYKKELIRRSNASFAEGMAHEDLPFYISTMLNARKIALIRKNLYNYRVLRVDSSSNTATEKTFDDLLKVHAYIESSCEGHHDDRNLRKSFSLFKVRYLLAGLNGIFRNKNVSRLSKNNFFAITRRIFLKEDFPFALSKIDQLQYVMIRNGWRRLFQMKVFSDLTKEKIL